MILRFITAIVALHFSASTFASCDFTVEVGDNLKFSVAEIVAGKDCESVTVNLTHTGKLPANAMGHNWVLSKNADAQPLAAAGITAGLDKNYLPVDDGRVIASTRVVGGGESDSVTFSIAGLDQKSYTFFCSFPGHSAVMKGSFKIN